MFSITGVLLTFTSSGVANVYICKGKYSKKYHYRKEFRDLSNCSTDIYQETLENAKKLGGGLCGWEDNLAYHLDNSR